MLTRPFEGHQLGGNGNKFLGGMFRDALVAI